MKKSFFLIFATIMLLGCSHFSEQEAVTEMSMVSMSDEMEAFPEEASYLKSEDVSSNRNVKSAENKNSPVNNQPIINKKIIKTGSVEIQSDNVQKSRDELEKLLNNTKSYVQNENFYDEYYREKCNLTIRVPNQNFDILLNSLNNKGIGNIRSKNVSAKDVTEDYYDTEIRLKNKELYLAKYRDFLSQAKKISDMLEIQETIRNMEEEIESAKGKLRFIDDRVNFSTLDISIYREKPNTSSGMEEIGFLGRILESIVYGWNVLANILFGILSLWSVILIFGLIIWGIVKMVKVRKNRKARQ